MTGKNVTVYGIKNCDTVRKCLKWLDAHGVAYEFHNYKSEGVNVTALKDAMVQHGWEQVINRRGTTWKKLPEEVREHMNEARAIEAACENASLIKRPMIFDGNCVILGFDERVLRDRLGLEAA